MRDLPLISSLSNPTVKRVRALRQGKARARSGLFVVEGFHHIGSALEAGWELEHLLYAPELLGGGFAAELLQAARGRGFAPQPVSTRVMENLAEKDNPQGILAVVHQQMAGLSEIRKPVRGVALVSPQDPGNVGSILRTIEAVGAGALFLLDGGVELFHPTLVRASMGTLFRIPVVQLDFQAFQDWARQTEVRLVASSAHAEGDYLAASPVAPPWVLVMGNEQKGLSPEQIAACDLAVAIPMRGRTSSLNLAVVAGILLYALSR